MKVKKRRKSASKFSVQLNFEKIDWKIVDRIFAADRTVILKQLDGDCQLKPNVRIILKLLAAGSIIGISTIFPTFPMIAAPIIGADKFNRSMLGQTIKRLEKQNLVEIIYPDGQPLVKITQNGKIRALRYKLFEMKINKPRRWDGKWRLVIFDIPEKFKRMREIFRYHLKMMGFFPMQKSVWVFPYPCFNEIEFLRQVYGVGFNVSYVIAEKIEEDDFLKPRFDIE